MCTGRKWLNNIHDHYIDNHLTPCEHKATGKEPLNSLPFVDIQRIVVFPAKHTEEHAILLPGRIPGYKSSDMKLLPYSTTKKVSINNSMPIVG